MMPGVVTIYLHNIRWIYLFLRRITNTAMITITIIATTTAATAPAIIPIGGPSGTTREYIVRHGDSAKYRIN